jgi:putative phosphoesterase
LSSPWRLGVIADTHGLLRPEALTALRGCDHILHAGDIGNAAILEALAALAPVTAVRGNNDAGPWAAALPESATLTFGDTTIFLLHDRKQLPSPPPLTQVVIAGHSHRPSVTEEAGVLFLNPGSAGPRRFSLPISLALLTLGGDQPQAELVTLGPNR